MQNKILGVIGHPIHHSLSPTLHEFFIAKAGLEASYHAFDVAPEDIESAIKGAKALGLTGLNVTVPHKQNVMPFLDEIDDFAQKVGAVNTIHFKGNTASGWNTDVPGLIKNLAANNVTLDGKDIVILGAGGAARATVMAAKNSGAGSIAIYNRTPSRAEALAADFDSEWLPSIEKECLPDDCIIINTTSVGMHPHRAACPLQMHHFRKKRTFVDLVYNPIETTFLKNARACGAQCVDGLGMLIYQGAIALGIWMGRTIEIDRDYEQLRQLLLSRIS